MLDRLQISELQKIIGEARLHQMREILPYIPESGLKHPNDVYEKKTLIKIFLSFVGQDFFCNVDNRKFFLSRQSEEDLKKFSQILNITPPSNFNDLVDKIARIKWADNSETKKFIEFFHLPEYYLPAAKQEVFDVENLGKAEVPYKILKDYQTQVYQEAMDRLHNPLQRFILRMPTGSGKTRTAMEIICSALNEKPGRTVIWLSHSDELCEQAIECFKDVWQHVGIYKVNIIRMWGNHKINVPITSSFIVAGFSKLNSAFRKNAQLAGIISKNAAIVVVDEAHRVTAPTYKLVIEKLMEKNYETHLIGLTATPGRGTVLGSEETKELSEFFSSKKIEIFSGDMGVFEYLRSKKVLAQIIKDPLINDRIYELSKSNKKYIAEHFDFPNSFLETISKDNFRNIEIIKKLHKEAHSNKKIIFFGCSVDHSKFICAFLILLGIRAEHLDSNTSDERRKNIIQQFKKGDLQILCNFGILKEGFDAPKTDVIFIARPTTSVVLYSQMVGRGLRGPAIGGKEICKLIDVIDNIEVYKSPDNVYDYFEEYWHNE